MRILVALTYYAPYTSGLTIYAQRLAEALVRRGHQVSVLASRHLPELPEEEVLNGVRVVRAPVAFHLSKGTVMPSFGRLAGKLVRESDIVQLHLPQFDGARVAVRAGRGSKPVVITYHCDLVMPRGAFNRIANAAVTEMDRLAARQADAIVSQTKDYAEHSLFLRQTMNKVRFILPPIQLPEVSSSDVAAFRQEQGLESFHPVIGMAARLASEKGVEVLLSALPSILARFPQALVLYVGPYEHIRGEEAYFHRLEPAIRDFEAGGHWRFLGVLSNEQMVDFYRNLDVLVLPSLNSTEAFGMVQIEAMVNGVPVAASDLPGVRQGVAMHGMGLTFPVGDPAGLGQAVVEIVSSPERYRGTPESIRRIYDPDTVAGEYEKLFDEVLSRRTDGQVH